MTFMGVLQTVEIFNQAQYSSLVKVTARGGSSIVKVPGDVPPARVCFFQPSSLAKGILFANVSPFSLAKGMLLANFHTFSLGKGILFGNFGQRNVKLR